MGTIIFVILFVASNVLIGTSGFIIWYNNVLGMQQTPYALTMFVPFAKMVRLACSRVSIERLMCVLLIRASSGTCSTSTVQSS